MSGKRVLSVGQCGADHFAISSMLQKTFATEVVAAHDAEEAQALLRENDFALVLVNRVLDANGTSGVELIGHIKADKTFPKVPVMLVSNYEDAQRQAVENGALPGFGKASLTQPRTVARLRAILGEQ